MEALRCSLFAGDKASGRNERASPGATSEASWFERLRTSKAVTAWSAAAVWPRQRPVHHRQTLPSHAVMTSTVSLWLLQVETGRALGQVAKQFGRCHEGADEGSVGNTSLCGLEAGFPSRLRAFLWAFRAFVGRCESTRAFLVSPPIRLVPLPPRCPALFRALCRPPRPGSVTAPALASSVPWPFENPYRPVRPRVPSCPASAG